jgi:hypothetical protein
MAACPHLCRCGTSTMPIEDSPQQRPSNRGSTNGWMRPSLIDCSSTTEVTSRRAPKHYAEAARSYRREEGPTQSVASLSPWAILSVTATWKLRTARTRLRGTLLPPKQRWSLSKASRLLGIGVENRPQLPIDVSPLDRRWRHTRRPACSGAISWQDRWFR